MPNHVLFLLCLLGAQTLNAAAAPACYPTHGWRESTPEEKGLDSKVLAAMVDNITQKRLNMHSVTVIRHGYVVLDAYFYPYRASAPHDVASVTKSSQRRSWASLWARGW